jgi:hypothetical protein
MQLQLVLSQQKLIFKSILIVSLSLVGFWGINYIVKHQKDESNLIALGLGGPGLLFTAWQTFMTIEIARNQKMDEKFAEIEKTFTERKNDSEMQDLRHDGQILELITKVAFVEQKLTLHSEAFGHPDTIRELFAVKDKINSVNATVAAIAQHGKVARDLSSVQLELSQLSKTVEGLINSTQ